MKVERDERGLVLVMVLAVVALFTVVVVDFASDETMEIELAYNFRDGLQARYLADAGMEAAMSLLAQDEPEYDADDEDWANFSEFAMLAAAYLPEDLGGASFSGTLTDERSKLDLNSLYVAEGQEDNRNYRGAQLKRLMMEILQIDITDDEFTDLLNALVDWIDPDSETDFGAENEYYESLERPYECKDGPMDSTEEILLVKDMKAQWYYGTEEYSGIRDFVTVGTGGKVNLNTASEEVLRSCVPEGLNPDDVLEAVEDARPVKPDALQGLLETIGLKGAEQGEAKWIMEKQVFTVNSTRFAVEVQGAMGSGARVNVRAVLERAADKKPGIVYYKIY